MKTKHKVLIGLIVVIFAAIYYYITLPAINIHSVDFWSFIIVVFACCPVIYITKKRMDI